MPTQANKIFYRKPVNNYIILSEANRPMAHNNTIRQTNIIEMMLKILLGFLNQ